MDGIARRSALLWDSLIGFWRVWVAHLGRKHGILKALAGARGPLVGEELAHTLNLNPQAVEAWLSSAHALGIVEKRGGGYTLPTHFKTLLVEEDDPRFIGGLISYYALRSLDFDAFTTLFTNPTTVGLQGAHLAEAFEEGTRWDHTVFLRRVLPSLPTLHRTLKAGCRVLDLGCGSGGWIARLAPLFPKSHFVGVDLDQHSIERARAKCRGLANTEFTAARAEDLRYREEFHLVYLGEVLYAIGDKQRVIQTCYEALEPGGSIVVCEAVRDPGRNTWRDENTLVRGALLDYMAQGGNTLSRNELRNLIVHAGFTTPREHNMHGGLWFFTSRKPPKKHTPTKTR
ncbi:MAG: class I SAM-dependent methyltransferase [Thermoprotei archaeon]